MYLSNLCYLSMHTGISERHLTYNLDDVIGEIPIAYMLNYGLQHPESFGGLSAALLGLVRLYYPQLYSGPAAVLLDDDDDDDVILMDDCCCFDRLIFSSRLEPRDIEGEKVYLGFEQ